MADGEDDEPTCARRMTDRELIRIARQFRRGLLGRKSSTDMCMVVSGPLQGVLAGMGVETTLETVEFISTNHVWLRLPDGRVLDATADQFGKDAIYLGEEYEA